MQHVSSIKNFLSKPLNYIKGVGPKKADALKSLGCEKVKDLLVYIPQYYIDRTVIRPLNSINSVEVISQIVEISSIEKGDKGRYSKVLCFNSTGSISLLFFNSPKGLLSSLSVGDKIAISGKVTIRDSGLVMIHPDILVPANKAADYLLIEPIYATCSSINSRAIHSIIKEIIKGLPFLPEWLPDNAKLEHNLPSLAEAIMIIHNPGKNTNAMQIEKAVERLAFDEILAEQILLTRANKGALQNIKSSLAFSNIMQREAINNLPFSLTKGQINVLEEISNDQASKEHMLRLLQGDVGSGKTVVAFLAAMNTIEAGSQVILMAPTELLAKQHFDTFKKLFSNFNKVNARLLLGRMNSKEKEGIRKEMSNGDVDLIIGTHALIESKVQFNKVGLIVIDEQHKFGVMQRLELLQKGFYCDLLMMSATPIPRTMVMVCYGNIKVSQIKEKPKGRLPINTTLIPTKRLTLLIERVLGAVENGSKIYWICPLIEKSEKLLLSDVQSRYSELQKFLGDQVAMLHGKMKSEERDVVMEDFANRLGKIKVLVSTTVIEVGVDVHDADIMIIENAEHFGLAQIHQLRGRVGRGDKQSFCVLLYSNSSSLAARYRLEAMRKTSDGFKLAEKDLKLRGGGKIVGIKQSGIPNFKIYNYIRHCHLNHNVIKVAEKLLEVDNDGLQHIITELYSSFTQELQKQIIKT